MEGRKRPVLAPIVLQRDAQKRLDRVVTVQAAGESEHGHAGSLLHAMEPARIKDLVWHIKFHCTPKHASWLTITENEFSAMTGQCLSKRRICDLETLPAEVTESSADVNEG